ncbi:hypothetical protein ACP90_00475 [Labrenzia sp. CP4]|nr:hypothetical protein ACP90_00475 [Labrenzia sp. CP4]
MKRHAFFPFLNSVIPWLDHGIHADTLQIGKALRWAKVRGWIAGSSPAMTSERRRRDCSMIYLRGRQELAS